MRDNLRDMDELKWASVCLSYSTKGGCTFSDCAFDMIKDQLTTRSMREGSSDDLLQDEDEDGICEQIKHVMIKYLLSWKLCDRCSDVIVLCSELISFFDTNIHISDRWMKGASNVYWQSPFLVTKSIYTYLMAGFCALCLNSNIVKDTHIFCCITECGYGMNVETNAVNLL